jgi:transposase
VWLAVGHTDMRRGMNGLALQVQEKLGRDPHAGDLYVFRKTRSPGQDSLARQDGMSLYAKRLERGRFIWPSPADGTVAITPAQLAYMLDGMTGGTQSEPGGQKRPAKSWSLTSLGVRLIDSPSS